MNYSCLEELQTILDLHISVKTKVLSDISCKCNNGWFIITDDGHCHLFDKDGNLDDIKKIKYLKEHYIRKDIKKIIIPDGIVNIETDAFYGCYNITNVTIPDSVMSIVDGAFWKCTNLTSVTIGNNVTSIGSCAFKGCSGLTNVTIPDSVTNIGYGAFCRSGLTNMTIPDGITNIRCYVFEGCSDLTSVTILDSVTNIGYDAFYRCDALSNIIFKDKTLEEVKKMDSYPFGIKDQSVIQIE